MEKGVLIMMRQKILEQAIRLISDSSYESVSINDIAKSADITTAEFYNYFSGKNEILNSIYDTFKYIILSGKYEESEYISILKNGNQHDIIKIFDLLLPEPIPYHFCVIKIIWTRRFFDAEAQRIYLDYAYHASQKYIHEVLSKGIEIGRLDMQYSEIPTMAYTIHAAREFACNTAIINPDHTHWRPFEDEMMNMLAGLIRIRTDSEKGGVDEAESPAAILEEAITCDSLAVGRYYNYLSTLHRTGNSALSDILQEIIQNTLDEIDALYEYANQSELNEKMIYNKIIEHERRKQQAAKVALQNINEEIRHVFTEIIDLSIQHERLCREALDHLS